MSVYAAIKTQIWLQVELSGRWPGIVALFSSRDSSFLWFMPRFFSFMPHACCCSLPSMHQGLAEKDQTCRVRVWLMIVHFTLLVSTMQDAPSSARQVRMATEAQASPRNVVFNFIWIDCPASHCIAPTCHCHTLVLILLYKYYIYILIII